MTNELQEVVEEMEQSIERSIFAGWTDHETVRRWRAALLKVQQDLTEKDLTDTVNRLR